MSIPFGIRLLPNIRAYDITLNNKRYNYRNICYRVFILVLTFLCYAAYHLSRKPISVVKNVLHQNCTHLTPPSGKIITNSTTWCDWSPFDGDNYDSLFGTLDLAFLAAYAFGMFCSGYIAERMNLRYFMAIGMIGTGLCTAAFGLGYFFDIHKYAYYIFVQVIGGLLQSTGWPSVVTCMGNWYGKGRRGLIMGLWNSHTSVGNILGSIIPGIFADSEWGWSFVVPGIIIGSLGIIVFLFLVPHPRDVGCEIPDHAGKITASTETIQHSSSTASFDNVSDSTMVW